MNILTFVYEIARVVNVWLIFCIAGLIRKSKKEETSSFLAAQLSITGLPEALDTF